MRCQSAVVTSILWRMQVGADMKGTESRLKASKIEDRKDRVEDTVAAEESRHERRVVAVGSTKNGGWKETEQGHRIDKEEGFVVGFQ